MDLSNEEIQQIEEMSAALLPPDEIAILMNIPPAERSFFVQICKTHQASPIYIAYQRGKLTTKLELRKTVIKLAKAGSPAAEPLAEKYLKEQSSKE